MATGEEETVAGGGAAEAEVSGEISMEETDKPPVRILRDPGAPTEEEKEEHNATHIPYRVWCPICVESKGKEDPHFSVLRCLERIIFSLLDLSRAMYLQSMS